MKHYILDEHGNPTPEPDLARWESWLETANLHVADDRIKGVRISTVFVPSLDEADPALWETAVIGGHLDQVRDRCTGQREQAEAMHAKMVERVKSQQQHEP